jgi:hypothetical protein
MKGGPGKKGGPPPKKGGPPPKKGEVKSPAAIAFNFQFSIVLALCVPLFCSVLFGGYAPLLIRLCVCMHANAT